MNLLLCSEFLTTSCNATSYGKTKRYFRICILKYMLVSTRTSKNIKLIANSALRNQILVYANIALFLGFSILSNGSSDS